MSLIKLIIVILFFLNSIFYIFLSRRKYKSLINPVFILNSVMVVVSFLSLFGLYGLYVPSELTYVVIYISCFVFSIVSITKTKVINTYDSSELNINQTKSKRKNKRFRILAWLNVFSYFFIMPFTIEAIKILLSKGVSYLRAYSLAVGGLNTSLVDQIILQWVIQGIFYGTILYALILFAKNDNYKIPLSFALIDIILYSVTFGGRRIILFSIIYLIISLILFSRKNRFWPALITNKKRKKIHILLFLAMGILSVFYITSKRGFSGDGFISSLIIYYVGGLNILDKAISEFGLLRINEFLLGTATIGGLIDPPLAVFSFLTGVEFLRPTEIVLGFSGQIHLIGENLRFTAFTTWLYPFIRDFGIFGVIMMPVVFAIIIKRIFYLAFSKGDIYFQSLYVYLLYVLTQSSIGWEFTSQYTWFGLMFLFIFTRNDRRTIS